MWKTPIYDGKGDDSLTGGSGTDIFIFSEGNATPRSRGFDSGDGDTMDMLDFDQSAPEIN